VKKKNVVANFGSATVCGPTSVHRKFVWPDVRNVVTVSDFTGRSRPRRHSDRLLRRAVPDPKTDQVNRTCCAHESARDFAASAGRLPFTPYPLGGGTVVTPRRTTVGGSIARKGLKNRKAVFRFSKSTSFR